MNRVYTCIVCPNGCEIEARMEDDGKLTIQGAICPKGERYVQQEITDPQRTIASSIRVRNGALPLVSVRLDRAIPKDRLMDVMGEISKTITDAPVQMGACLIANVLGLDCNVIASKSVDRV